MSGVQMQRKEEDGMCVEEFLQSARESELEIERMAEMLLRLDARAKRVTAVYRQSGGGKEAVEAFVARIGQSRYREMLRMRFLSYLTIEEAAERMGYSYDAGKRLSAQAMRAARAIWEAEHAAE